MTGDYAREKRERKRHLIRKTVPRLSPRQECRGRKRLTADSEGGKKQQISLRSATKRGEKKAVTITGRRWSGRYTERGKLRRRSARHKEKQARISYRGRNPFPRNRIVDCERGKKKKNRLTSPLSVKKGGESGSQESTTIGWELL